MPVSRVWAGKNGAPGGSDAPSNALAYGNESERRLGFAFILRGNAPPLIGRWLAHLNVGSYPPSRPLQGWANLWLTLPSPLGSLEVGQPRITTRPKNTGAALDGKRQGRVP